MMVHWKRIIIFLWVEQKPIMKYSMFFGIFFYRNTSVYEYNDQNMSFYILTFVVDQ